MIFGRDGQSNTEGLVLLLQRGSIDELQQGTNRPCSQLRNWILYCDLVTLLNLVSVGLDEKCMCLLALNLHQFDELVLAAVLPGRARSSICTVLEGDRPTNRARRALPGPAGTSP
jgi:hypothetical protein